MSSLATLYGAATRPDRKVPPLSMHASSFLGPIAYCRVTQTSTGAVLLKQQRLLVSLSAIRVEFDISASALDSLAAFIVLLFLSVICPSGAAICLQSSALV